MYMWDFVSGFCPYPNVLKILPCCDICQNFILVMDERIPWYGYTSLLIQYLMDIWFVPTFWLL